MEFKLMAAALIIVVAGSMPVCAEKKPDGGLPYANDLGVKTVDVKAYPKEIQEGYKLLMSKCAKCHVAHRALNSEKVQIKGDKKAQTAALKATLKKLPEGDNPRIWLIEPDVLMQSVTRMMNKEDSGITKADAGKIYKFLVHDGIERKLNKPDAWVKDRKKMLSEFKEKHPDAYEEIYAE